MRCAASDFAYEGPEFPNVYEYPLELTPFMKILDDTTIPDFVHSHKKVLALLFKVRNFKVNADKSESSYFVVRLRTLQPIVIVGRELD